MCRDELLGTTSRVSPEEGIVCDRITEVRSVSQFGSVGNVADPHASHKCEVDRSGLLRGTHAVQLEALNRSDA